MTNRSKTPSSKKSSSKKKPVKEEVAEGDDDEEEEEEDDHPVETAESAEPVAASQSPTEPLPSKQHKEPPAVEAEKQV